MPYKIGDVILITGKKRKKLQGIIREYEVHQASLTHLSILYGNATTTLWNALKKEYPEVFKDFEMTYNNFKLKVSHRRYL